MSRRTREWVLERSPVKRPMARALLLELAWAADDRGRGARRSWRQLADVTGCHPTTVFRWLRRLESEGHIRRHPVECGCGECDIARRGGLVVYDVALADRAHLAPGQLEFAASTPAAEGLQSAVRSDDSQSASCGPQNTANCGSQSVANCGSQPLADPEADGLQSQPEGLQAATHCESLGLAAGKGAPCPLQGVPLAAGNPLTDRTTVKTPSLVFKDLGEVEEQQHLISSEPSRSGSASRGRAGGRARGGPPVKPVAFRGRTVPRPVVQSAERLLAAFNEALGSRLSARTPDGRATGNLKRVVGKLLEHPDEPEDVWLRGLRSMIEDPPSWVTERTQIWDVFGPNSVEHTLVRGRRGDAGAPVVPRRNGRVDWGAVATRLEAEGR